MSPTPVSPRSKRRSRRASLCVEHTLVTKMRRILKMRIPVVIYCVVIASAALPVLAADDPDIEALWTRWKAGDEDAYGQLNRLGPESRDLAHRILYPDSGFP